MVQIVAGVLLLSVLFGALVFVLGAGDRQFEQLYHRLKVVVSSRGVAVRRRNKSSYNGYDFRRLNCRVCLANEQRSGRSSEVFKVELCGTMQQGEPAEYPAVRVRVDDVTEQAVLPVYGRLSQHSEDSPQSFVYSAGLSNLSCQDRRILQWTSVARIHTEWLILPRRGHRKLSFNVSLVSRESGRQLGTAGCVFEYENPSFGYLDEEENIERAKTLAVALAFAVSTADGQMNERQVELIKEWTRSHIGFAGASDSSRDKLEKALEQTVVFFRSGKQVDVQKICGELAGTTPTVVRCDILSLCLQVAGARGSVGAEATELLKNLAKWMEVDMERFRGMMEKILPANMHQSQDAELILGVRGDMDKEEVRHVLNREYRKWNARVTSSDPQVQAQADHMLRFIAEARKEYVA